MMDRIRALSTVQNLLWLALILALVGSLSHVADTFASIDGNWPMGWVQGVAVDIGLIGLALGIAQRRRLKLPTKVYWLGLALFTIISVYANVDYAFRALSEAGGPLQTAAIVKAFVMSATLPVLALYLAEIVGGQAMRNDTQPQAQDAPQISQPIRIDTPANGKVATAKLHKCKSCGEMVANPGAHTRHECTLAPQHIIDARKVQNGQAQKSH